MIREVVALVPETELKAKSMVPPAVVAVLPAVVAVVPAVVAVEPVAEGPPPSPAHPIRSPRVVVRPKAVRRLRIFISTARKLSGHRFKIVSSHNRRVIPQGFLFSGVRCGLKNRRNDVGLLVSDRPARAAGVFTTNQVRAACVDVSREAIADGSLRAVVVNSGNANCCTGEQGERDARRMVELAASALEVSAAEIAVASTGVIGHLLDMAKVEKGIAEAGTVLSADPNPFKDAILTTDLVEKEAFAEVGGAKIYGVAKGSGMIAPNMAT
ncbi:hypothetical protein EON81_20575, partial [bacterium]